MKAVARSDMEQGGAGDRIAELGGKVDRLGGRVDELGGRMDELGRRVENGFNRIDAKLDKQAESMAGEFKRVDAKLDKRAESMAGEFKRFDARLTDELTAVRKEMSEGFLRMQRLMIQGGGGIVITLLVASRLFGVRGAAGVAPTVRTSPGAVLHGATLGVDADRQASTHDYRDASRSGGAG